MSVVEVDDLRVELESTGRDVVAGVTLRVEAGEVLALVGESGSGKTTVASALLGFARRGARIAAGTVRIDGHDVVPEPRGGLRELRGKVVAYIPQDPAVALNPAMRIGVQIEETLAAHKVVSSKDARLERVRSVLAEVRLPFDDEFLKRFPHQLSGGQQQRVCIAIAICCSPRVIVMDEPTTGLDVSTQAHVLRTLSDLVRAHGMAALYVTHDLAVVANIADRIMVLYSGRTAEYGQRGEVFSHPAHPYTSGLLGAAPDLHQRNVLTVIPGRAPSLSERPEAGCRFAPRCQWAIDECERQDPEPITVAPDHVSACLRAAEVIRSPLARTGIAAASSSTEGKTILEARDLHVVLGGKVILDSLSFELQAGECLALVGESGSGKTTLSRSIVGLIEDRTGEILFDGEALPVSFRQYPRRAHQKLQYIFQSPYNSLNPRRSVGSTLSTPLKHFFDFSRREQQSRVDAALDRVSLSRRVKALYPDQLSGGERQRVAIARALVCEPDVLLCDEITSALDVSVQAAIVDLLEDLRRADGLSILFVTHNIALVRSVADRLMVLDHGNIVETGRTETVLHDPKSAYTKALLVDTPSLQRDSHADTVGT